MTADIAESLAAVRQGEAPGSAKVLREISVGLEPLADFLAEHYLEGFVAQGGSKIKFVTGSSGSGKTFFLRHLGERANRMGFITVHCSARELWAHNFAEIYAEVFKQANLPACLKRCAGVIAKAMGADPDSIPEGGAFADLLSAEGSWDALAKKEVRNQLQAMFLQNPLIDNNFAIACGLLTGGILGHPQLEPANRELLLAWLSGSRDFKLSALRALGFSPGRITKFNARHMLRSLAEVCRMAGYPGIVVLMDELDVLVRTKPLDALRYTRMKRDDAYESIRELIDEIDTLKNLLFVFAFDRVLIDDEGAGLKSYQALWMRVQNEITSKRFNKFTDIIDMDKYAEANYDRDTLVEMSRRLADWYNRFDNKADPIEASQAEDMLSKARFGKNALPRQVNNATLQTDTGSRIEDSGTQSVSAQTEEG